MSALIAALFTAPAFAGTGPPCVVRAGNGCGGVEADLVEGDFHGLIMVPGQPDVLDTAAHSGTKPGCGDCTWTLIIACIFDRPDQASHDQTPCAGLGLSAQCRRGQTLFRLYLTTDAVTNQLVDTLCLGGKARVIPVGDIAAADVQRYLKDVRPPLMNVSFEPPRGALAGLPTYAMADPPADLAPQQLGGVQVTETITVTPAHYVWSWGDGSPDLHTDDPGGPYPDGNVTHTYDLAGRMHGTLTTEWSATYTITVAGATYGPYDATGGTVQRTQPFTLVVDRARSHLVSGD